MTIRELHKITSELLAKHGDDPVAIDYRTFLEQEDISQSILEIQAAEVRDVQGSDDSGPVGNKYPFLVLTGSIEWHAHGESFQ